MIEEIAIDDQQRYNNETAKAAAQLIKQMAEDPLINSAEIEAAIYKQLPKEILAAMQANPVNAFERFTQQQDQDYDAFD